MTALNKLKNKASKIKYFSLIFNKKNGVALIVAIIVIAVYFLILKDLPSPTTLSSTSTPQSTQILDRNGKLLYSIYDNQNRTFVPLTQIPKNLQDATIAIEDKDFYHHGAVDFRGIARSIVSIVIHKQIQGGSTLTQQLVKNTLLTPQQTIQRKIKEILLSFVTEELYSKQQILEMYLNQIPYGGTAYGVEAASDTFFGVHVQDLDLAESALLAGLPEEPTNFSPFGSHPEYAKARQEEVLNAMEQQGYITKSQEQKAVAEPLHYQNIAGKIKAPHFVFYIKDLLVQQYGEKFVEEGGLKVRTSLDLDTQEMAEASVAAEVNAIPKYYHVSNGASLVTNPATGEILAMVGSKDYFDTSIDGNVNVTIADRQPGSSIKPINYALGLINGYTPSTPLIDQKTCFNVPGQPPYCPVNYDGKFHGVVSVRDALGNSLNIPAVKMLKLNGVANFIATASAMGISTFGDPSKYGLSLTLGGGEVTMTDMATAFGVLANGGYRVDLHPILQITDKSGKTIQQYTPPPSPIFGKKVLPDGVAFIISNILADNNARALEFGPSSQLKIGTDYVSVKTGTTNDFKDNWTIGYTPSTLVAVWVGNDDNTAMSGLVSGITGAAPIWNDIMSQLLLTRPASTPIQPAAVVGKNVCNTTGEIPGAGNSCPTHFEYFLTNSLPKNYVSTENVAVDKTTQDLAPQGQTDNIDMKSEQILTDPTGDKYCLSCPHPTPSPTPAP